MSYLCNMKKLKKVLKWSAIALVSPIALFLLLAILIYIPPIQNFIVHQVADNMSERMGMNINIDKVRLAFPLDLAIHRMTAIEGGDTLINVDRMRLDVKLLPLFKGRADIDGFSLYGLKLDTKSYISDTHIKGIADELTATSHGIDWEKEYVNINHAHLRDANFVVALSDTAQKDTTESKAKWKINVAKADIERSKIRLSMPGDSMRIYANLTKASLRNGLFDTGRNDYAIHSLQLRSCNINYDIPYIKPTCGLDANHIGLSNLTLLLDTLSYNQQGTLRAGVRALSFKEKCGLNVIKLKGGVYMDTAQLRLPALSIRTSQSDIEARVAFDFRSFKPGKGGHCKAYINAQIGNKDIRNIGQGFLDKQYLNMLPTQPLIVKGKLMGNIDHINLSSLSIKVPLVAQLSAHGYVRNILKNWRSGKLT